MSRYIALMLAFAAILAGLPRLARAQETVYTGSLGDERTAQAYPVSLSAGQSVLLLAETTSGDLDPVLMLTDPNGRMVAQNDDRSQDSMDAAVGFRAVVSGSYTVTVRRYSETGTAGSFRLTITIGDLSVLAPLENLTGLRLSGERLSRDTDHFRIYYTLTGRDAVTPAFVDAVALTVEEVWRLQIERMGWPPPPSIVPGDDRYHVYLADLIGEREGSIGYTSPQNIIGDNPNSAEIEEYAATSFIVIDNDFLASDFAVPPVSLMRTTVSHEFNHAIQFGYDVADTFLWYYEATATWMETTVLTKDQAATDYVAAVFQYPELCFGVEDEPTGGEIVYGLWLFMQSLTDRHGEQAARHLWENIARYEGFAALEQTLALYEDTIPSSVANYHVQNLLRDYELAPDFDATVWLQNTIDAGGRWESGGGVQELGANYFALKLPSDTYYTGLMNDDGLLELWAVGVRDGRGEAFALGRGGTIDTGAYDHVYLMVFNPHYDDNLDDCRYYDFSLDIAVSKETPTVYKSDWDAAHFEPLK